MATATKPNTVGHVPPHAAELEKAVLGAAMLEERATRTVLATFQDEKAFYDLAHQHIFRAMRALASAGKAIDSLTVVAQLRELGVLERVGGAAYVAGLTLRVNSSANLETHCRIVQQYYLRRTVINLGLRLSQHGYDEAADPLDLLSEAQLGLNNVHRSVEGRPVQSAAGVYDAVFAQLLAAVENPGLTGIPTGIRELNTATGGWQDSDLVIMAARPGMGKTAAMLHHARTAALDHGKAVAIFSMEMPTEQLITRMIASETGEYTNAELRHGKLRGGAEEVGRLRTLAERLRTDKLLIDDTPGLHIAQLRAKAARLKAEHDIALVLVDYIQLMKGEAKGSREQEIGSISRGLKEMAKELNVPVIALAQLSRDVEKRGGEHRPKLSDLRESGSIEQDADLIIFLWRGEYYDITEYSDGASTANTILYDLAKHRSGAQGEVITGCTMHNGRFFDLGSADAEYASLQVGPTQLGALPASKFDEPDNDLPF
ncbi:replicative DNA helicase [Hymenobacter saemangeumensis]|uniref:Replicative DNA helicase n=1 Tax=Hymenobacter saemangeumensis TaxID=1084522 RepID=A0ABP8IL84_9BACT